VTRSSNGVQVLRVWARILRAVPGSRLLLKNKPFACASARAHTSAALAAHGVDSSRVRPPLPLACDIDTSCA
jgi:predicted O-linked N-acetylglucosamine transferase (SPINDLY family)